MKSPALQLLCPTSEQEFEKWYKTISDQLLNLHSNSFGSGPMQQETAWAGYVLAENVLNTKRLSWGILAPAFLQALKLKTADDRLSNSYILGWMVNMFNASCNISDNILNEEKASAWHHNPKVGMAAVNDCFILRMMRHNVAKLFIADEALVNQIHDAFRETNQIVLAGVALEEALKKGSKGLTYAVKKYRQVIKYKFVYPCLISPVCGALILAGQDNKKALNEKIKKIMLEIGYLIAMRVEWTKIFVADNRDLHKPTKTSWFYTNAVEKLGVTGNNEKIETVEKAIHNGDWSPLLRIYKELDLLSSFYKEINSLYDNILNQVFVLKNDVESTFFIRVIETFS